MMDLDFSLLGSPPKAGTAGQSDQALNSTMAPLGMGDMLASLDSLGEPVPAAPLTGSSSSGALADAAVNAWLASLPSLSFMLADKLVLPS